MSNSLRHPNTFNIFSCKIDYFKNYFLLSVNNEWHKLNPDIRNCNSEGIFRNAVLKFIRLVSNKTDSISDPIGQTLLTRSRVGFTHLRKQKI